MALMGVDELEQTFDIGATSPAYSIEVTKRRSDGIYVQETVSPLRYKVELSIAKGDSEYAKYIDTIQQLVDTARQIPNNDEVKYSLKVGSSTTYSQSVIGSSATVQPGSTTAMAPGWNPASRSPTSVDAPPKSNTNPATVSPQPGVTGFSQSSRSPTTPAVAPASQAAPQKNALGVVLDAVGLSIGTDKTGMHVGAQPKFWLIVGGLGVAIGAGYWYWRK